MPIASMLNFHVYVHVCTCMYMYIYCIVYTVCKFTYMYNVHDVIRDVERKKERKTPEAMEKCTCTLDITVVFLTIVYFTWRF